MKRMTLLGLLTLTTLASAQTRIGNVTLTRPQAQPTSAPATAGSTVAVPSGWYEVQGKISAPKAVTLPSGSTVHVYLEDSTVAKTTRQMLHISFGTSRLPSSYQMVFNPSRLNAAHQYTLRATVTDASGKQLYSGSAQSFSKGSHSIDLSVR